MKVVLNQTWASPLGSGKQGDVVDVPTKVAKQLIAAGAAVKEANADGEAPSIPDSTPRKSDPPIADNRRPEDPSTSDESPSESESTDADAQGEDADGETDPSATTPSPAEGSSAPRRPLTLGRGRK